MTGTPTDDPAYANCTCKKIKCPRYHDCDACRVHHYSKEGLPKCERGKGG